MFHDLLNSFIACKRLIILQVKSYISVYLLRPDRCRSSNNMKIRGWHPQVGSLSPPSLLKSRKTFIVLLVIITVCVNIFLYNVKFIPFKCMVSHLVQMNEVSELILLIFIINIISFNTQFKLFTGILYRQL